MPRPQSELEYQIQDTIGDGNCAYNAFALRLCKKKIFKNVEATLAKDGLSPDAEFAFFIKEAAFALGVAATWDAVKKESLRLRRHDPKALQKKLAQPLRNWSVELLNDPTKNETLEQSLLATFDVYPAKTDDDIFRRHSFVEEKFKKFKADVKHTVNNVKTWWRAEGFNHFQNEMKKDGTFSGDDYLSALSKKLRLNLAVIAKRFDPKRPVVLQTSHGDLLMPHLSYMQAKELASRQVVMGPIEEKKFDASQPLRLMTITKEKMTANLSAVPNHAEIKTYLETHKPKKDSRIPAEWKNDEEGLHQLELRGLIHKKRFAVDCSKPDTLAEMLQRIDVIPGRDDIIAKQQSAYRDVETLYLTNPNAVHWSSVKVVSKAVAEKAIIPTKKIDAKSEKVFFTNTLTYLKTDAAKPSASKWDAIVKQATAEALTATVSKDAVNYALANAIMLMKTNSKATVKETVIVNKDTQIELDAELAKELQQQEYAAFKGKKRY